MKNIKLITGLFGFILIIFSIISYKLGQSNQIKIQEQYSIDYLLNLVKKKEVNKIDSLITENLLIESVKTRHFYDDQSEDFCKGFIKNDAKIAVAKDVVVLLQYFTKTKSFIDSDTLKIYEYVKPQDSIFINVPISKPELTSQIDVKIISVDVE